MSEQASAALRRRLFAAIVMLSALVCPAAADGTLPGRWGGLCGESLKNALRGECSPREYVHAYLGEGGLWQIMRLADSDEGKTGYVNRFAGGVIPYALSSGEGPDALLIPVIAPGWWEVYDGNRKNVASDMYNLWPAGTDVANLKGEYAPGTVTRPVYSAPRWSVGEGMIGGMPATLWQPPVGYEGDVARVVFYLFTIYPDGLVPFGGYGSCYVGEYPYPGLSDGALRQLLAWHRGDLPDEAERCRNEVFGQWQGNVNPFVEYPALAEYVWGDKRNVPIGDEGPGEDISPGENDRIPLRSRYTLGDGKIDLFSPHVPDDAAWTVDGCRVESGFIVPSDLGAGVHELRFESPSTVGKILIEIVP